MADAGGDGFEFGESDAAERCFGCGAVDGVYHYLAGGDGAVGLDEGVDLGVGGIVDGHAIVFSAGKHGLYDARTCELPEAVDGLGNGIARRGTVEQSGGFLEGAVELEDIVVDPAQRIGHSLVGNAGGVGENADFHLGKILVAQGDGIVDNPGEIGMKRRFSVTRECDYVERLAVLAEEYQFFLEQACRLLARRQSGGTVALGIVAGLAVDTVERAYFTVVRHKVYAKRRTEPP